MAQDSAEEADKRALDSSSCTHPRVKLLKEDLKRNGLAAAASTSRLASLEKDQDAQGQYAPSIDSSIASLEDETAGLEIFSPASTPSTPFVPPHPSSIKTNLSMSDLHSAAVEARVTQKDVVVVFGEMLQQMAQASTARKSGSSAGAVFAGEKIPKVDIGVYLWRIVYYLNKYPAVEPTFFAESEKALAAEVEATKTPFKGAEAMSRGLRCLLLALLYIDRVSEKHEGFAITPFTVHRVLLTAMLVAIKFTDDHPIGVDVFARLGGVQRKSMRQMELQFCSLIGFDFNISEPEFERNCMKQLQLAFEVARKRGGSHTQSKSEAGELDGSQTDG